MIQEQGEYYLYRHVRLDTNQVFYVGIGTKGRRRKYKRAECTKHRNSFWKRIVSKTKYEIEILFHSDDRTFILEKEKEFIELYGRANLGEGTLCNLTDGGEGNIGVIVSEERRKQISEHTKKMVKSPQFLEMLSKMDYSYLKKKVYQYDLEGNFIQEWESATDAAKQLNLKVRSLSACASDSKHSRKKRLGGYIWRKYKIDKLPDSYLKMPEWTTERREKYLTSRSKNYKKIKMICPDGQEMIFNSTTDIINTFSFDRSSILKCCKNKNKSYKKHYFEYVTEQAEAIE